MPGEQLPLHPAQRAVKNKAALPGNHDAANANIYQVNQLAMFSGRTEKLKSDRQPSASISRHLLMQEHPHLNGCLNGEGA